MRRNANAATQEVALYSLAEAARYLHLSQATARSWLKGRHYPVTKGTAQFDPLVQECPNGGLSFLGFVEMGAIAELRRLHGVSIAKIRSAISSLRKRLREEGPHPLAVKRLWTDGSEILIREIDRYESLTEDGQQLIQEAVDGFLERVKWHRSGLPKAFFPRPSDRVDRLSISMDPRIRFGQPVVVGTSVRTWVVADRFQAGDDIDSIAKDYGIARVHVEDALRLERSLPAA